MGTQSPHLSGEVGICLVGGTITGRTTALVSWGEGQVGKTSGVRMILSITGEFGRKNCVAV
jgi:hypothetical protein